MNAQWVLNVCGLTGRDDHFELVPVLFILLHASEAGCLADVYLLNASKGTHRVNQDARHKHLPRYTVEPRPIDTPDLWTPHHCGHFLSGPFLYNPIVALLPVATPTGSFTGVGTSLLWTRFARPSGVHITKVLLYIKRSSSPNGRNFHKYLSRKLI